MFLKHWKFKKWKAQFLKFQIQFAREFHRGEISWNISCEYSHKTCQIWPVLEDQVSMLCRFKRLCVSNRLIAFGWSRIWGKFCITCIYLFTMRTNWWKVLKISFSWWNKSSIDDWIWSSKLINDEFSSNSSFVSSTSHVRSQIVHLQWLDHFLNYQNWSHSTAKRIETDSRLNAGLLSTTWFQMTKKKWVIRFKILKFLKSAKSKLQNGRLNNY